MPQTLLIFHSKPHSCNLHTQFFCNFIFPWPVFLSQSPAYNITLLLFFRNNVFHFHYYHWNKTRNFENLSRVFYFYFPLLWDWNSRCRSVMIQCWRHHSSKYPQNQKLRLRILIFTFWMRRILYKRISLINPSISTAKSRKIFHFSNVFTHRLKLLFVEFLGLVSGFFMLSTSNILLIVWSWYSWSIWSDMPLWSFVEVI